MKILVTGGAGFIGSHIVEHFNGNAEIVVLDNLETGYMRNLEGFNVNYINGSITENDTLKAAVKGVDYIFHMAAMVSVPYSMEKPVECVEVNTSGTLNLLKYAADAGVKKMCFSSSAAIYGDNPVSPKTEKMLPEPKSPYAVTKLDGEYYCKMFSDQGWLNTGIMRYFNVFGPRQDPNGQYAAAVPIFIAKALKNEDITIFGDGTQTRDFIYVKDIVAANVHLATNPSDGVYNIAYGSTITINQLAQKIVDFIGSSSKINYAPPRAGDVKHSCADNSRLLKTGITLTANFEEGLEKTIEFFMANRDLL